jgi:hypothetical protein
MFVSYTGELSPNLRHPRHYPHDRTSENPRCGSQTRGSAHRSGLQFDGDTVHYRPEAFHGTIAAISARHHFNLPVRPNYDAGVKSVHATIENEFFDLENFSGRAHFMAAAGIYQHFYNFARKNCSRADKTPVELLREKAPDLHPHILSLHPCLLDATWGNSCLYLPI